MDDERSKKRVFLELFRSAAKSGTLFFFTKYSDTQVMNAPHNIVGYNVMKIIFFLF